MLEVWGQGAASAGLALPELVQFVVVVVCHVVLVAVLVVVVVDRLALLVLGKPCRASGR